MKNNAFTQSPNRLLTIPEVAQTLQISRALAYNLVKTGELNAVHIRSAKRIRPEDLAAYIAKNMTSQNHKQ